MKNEINYTSVYIATSTLANKTIDSLESADVRVRTYGVSESTKTSMESLALDYMNSSLAKSDKSIPENLISIGYGPNHASMPYWTGEVRKIAEEVKNRIDKFGLDNVEIKRESVYLLNREFANINDAKSEDTVATISALRGKFLDNSDNRPKNKFN